MSRLIDADVLFSTHLIWNAPTVDAVQVVRCEDCKWFDRSEPSGTVEPIGYRCKRRWIFVDTDDFCKRGERREE